MNPRRKSPLLLTLSAALLGYPFTTAMPPHPRGALESHQTPTYDPSNSRIPSIIPDLPSPASSVQIHGQNMSIDPSPEASEDDDSSDGDHGPAMSRGGDGDTAENGHYPAAYAAPQSANGYGGVSLSLQGGIGYFFGRSWLGVV